MIDNEDLEDGINQWGVQRDEVRLFCTVVIAKSIGCILPLLAQRIRVDPALAASPLITTIVDACSLFIFFTIASNFIL